MNRAAVTYPSPSLTQNHSTSNNHSPPGQVYAANPLAPSSSVTTATSVTLATKANVSRECSWNEQLYYWSLEQAGLTQPLQYGWDPVISTNYTPLTGNDLHLQVGPHMTSWGSGPSSAPEKCPTPQTTLPPLPNSAPPCSDCGVTVGSKSHDNEQRSSPGPQADESGVYSLFNSSGKSLFGNYFESGPYADSGISLKWFNEGAPPPQHKDNEEKFDEWPAL